MATARKKIGRKRWVLISKWKLISVSLDLALCVGGAGISIGCYVHNRILLIHLS